MIEMDIVGPMPRQQVAESVPCPRCGYDQRGVIDSWIAVCPLEGRCAECGLDITWSEVVRPEKYEPRWCVEFDHGERFPKTAWRTLLRSFRPWVFWRELKMSHEIGWRRLAGYVCLLILPLVLVYVAEQTAVSVRVYQLIQQENARRQQWAQRWVPRQQKRIADAKAAGDVSEEEIRDMEAWLQRVTAAANQTAATTQPMGLAVLDAVIRPMSGKTRGWITSIWGADPYPSPRELHAYVFNSRNFSWPGLLGTTRGRAVLTRRAVFQLLMIFGMPLGFLLMPMSRRMAKVRWRHIGRVTAYSTFLPVALVCLIAAAMCAGMMIPKFSGWSWATALLLAQHGLWAFLVVWWAIAIRDYLKIPRGWIVAPVLAVVMLLVTTAVLFYAYPELLVRG